MKPVLIPWEPSRRDIARDTRDQFDPPRRGWPRAVFGRDFVRRAQIQGLTLELARQALDEAEMRTAPWTHRLYDDGIEWGPKITVYCRTSHRSTWPKDPNAKKTFMDFLEKTGPITLELKK